MKNNVLHQTRLLYLIGKGYKFILDLDQPLRRTEIHRIKISAHMFLKYKLNNAVQNKSSSVCT